MLEDIFNAIHKEEIVLPEERTGLVKEIYSWKVPVILLYYYTILVPSFELFNLRQICGDFLV